MAIAVPALGMAVIARDVATHLFFFRFPEGLAHAHAWADRIPPSPEAQRAHEEWLDGLLTRVVVRPRLTLPLVRRLATARDEILATYLKSIGWAPLGDEPLALVDDLEDDDESAITARPLISEQVAAWTTPAPSSITASVAAVAEHAHVAPSVIWNMPISEFLYSWRAVRAQHEEA